MLVPTKKLKKSSVNSSLGDPAARSDGRHGAEAKQTCGAARLSGAASSSSQLPGASDDANSVPAQHFPPTKQAHAGPLSSARKKRGAKQASKRGGSVHRVARPQNGTPEGALHASSKNKQQGGGKVGADVHCDRPKGAGKKKLPARSRYSFAHREKKDDMLPTQQAKTSSGWWVVGGQGPGGEVLVRWWGHAGPSRPPSTQSTTPSPRPGQTHHLIHANTAWGGVVRQDKTRQMAHARRAVVVTLVAPTGPPS